MKTSKFILIASLMLFCLQSQAGLLFNYSQLALRDLDQMNQMVNDKVKESKRSSSGKNVPLKEALQAVYSRPDEDGMIDKIVAPLRSNLDELEAWEKTISQLTDEAINALKNTKAFKPVVQVTYVIFLENMLAEIKPHVATSGFEKKIAERVRDANLTISKEAINERKLRTMKETTSPSEIAEKILSQAQEANEKAAATATKKTEESPDSSQKGQ